MRLRNERHFGVSFHKSLSNSWLDEQEGRGELKGDGQGWEIILDHFFPSHLDPHGIVDQRNGQENGC